LGFIVLSTIADLAHISTNGGIDEPNADRHAGETI
jgi:hypothetical protein